MILPLHHCSALQCDVLLDPGEFMCPWHRLLISYGTQQLLARSAPGTAPREHAELQARIEVAQLEGRNPTCSAYEFLPTPAGRIHQQPMPTTGAVEPGQTTTAVRRT